MKEKKHRFTVVVKCGFKREVAEIALLNAFATRQPDSCLFQLLRRNSAKKASVKK